MCVCVKAYIYNTYVIPIARTYIKVWGYVYIGESMVGQSARRLCTLFNFQRLPQYTNSSVVYKGLCVGYYMRVWGWAYIHIIYIYG